MAVLLPSRAPAPVPFLAGLADLAPLVAFVAGLAFLPDLPLDGATCAFYAATRAFLAGLGFVAGTVASVLAVSSEFPFILRSPFAVITAS